MSSTGPGRIHGWHAEASNALFGRDAAPVVVGLRGASGADGAIRISDLAARTSSTSVSRWIREGRLLRLLPHVVVTATPRAARA